MLVGMNGDARVLADGNKAPMLALGVWQVRDGPECVDAVRWALEAGYRHIDTAQAYGNEESVGRALRDSSVPRDQVFITTKYLPRRGDPVAQAEKSLRRLGVEQIDLYLVHWPQGGPTKAWAGMERARELGLARCAGACSTDSSSLPSRRTARASTRTHRFSASPCQPKIWPNSTRWIRPEVPTAPKNTSGGSRDQRALPSAMC